MGIMKNIQASAKSLAEHGIVNIAGAASPTDGVTGVGVCGKGSLYFSSDHGDMYINVGDATTPDWRLYDTVNPDTEAYSPGLIPSGEAGIGMLRIVVARFDPSANAGERTIGAHVLVAPDGSALTSPDPGLLVGGFVRNHTTATSATDAATIAIHVQSANDIVSAVAISNGGNPWDAGFKAIIPKANTPESTGIETGGDDIVATVAVEALTAGKFDVYLYFVPLFD